MQLLKIMPSVLMVLIVLCSIIHTCVAVECYACEFVEAQEDGETYTNGREACDSDPESVITTTCSGTCYKFEGEEKGDDYSGYVVQRGCVPTPLDCEEEAAEIERESDGLIKAHCCGGDLCNAATTTAATAAALVMLCSVAVALVAH